MTKSEEYVAALHKFAYSHEGYPIEDETGQLEHFPREFDFPDGEFYVVRQDKELENVTSRGRLFKAVKAAYESYVGGGVDNIKGEHGYSIEVDHLHYDVVMLNHTKFARVHVFGDGPDGLRNPEKIGSYTVAFPETLNW